MARTKTWMYKVQIGWYGQWIDPINGQGYVEASSARAAVGKALKEVRGTPHGAAYYRIEVKAVPVAALG